MKQQTAYACSIGAEYYAIGNIFVGVFVPHTTNEHIKYMLQQSRVRFLELFRECVSYKLSKINVCGVECSLDYSKQTMLNLISEETLFHWVNLKIDLNCDLNLTLAPGQKTGTFGQEILTKLRSKLVYRMLHKFMQLTRNNELKEMKLEFSQYKIFNSTRAEKAADVLEFGPTYYHRKPFLKFVPQVWLDRCTVDFKYSFSNKYLTEPPFWWTVWMNNAAWSSYLDLESFDRAYEIFNPSFKGTEHIKFTHRFNKEALMFGLTPYMIYQISNDSHHERRFKGGYKWKNNL